MRPFLFIIAESLSLLKLASVTVTVKPQSTKAKVPWSDRQVLPDATLTPSLQRRRTRSARQGGRCAAVTAGDEPRLQLQSFFLPSYCGCFNKKASALMRAACRLLSSKNPNFNLLAYSSIEACEKAVYYCINYAQSPCHTKMYLLQHAVSRCCDFCRLSVLSTQLRRPDPQLPRGLWVRKAPWFCILQNGTTVERQDVFFQHAS